MNDLTTGAKVVLGSTIAFLIVSFFTWFDLSGRPKELAEAVGVDTGDTMWHGVGWIAGLLAIGLLVWQAIRLANIELELGVTPSMITAALSVLVLIFALIRWLDTPGAYDRTFWAWLGLALAIVTVVGAWMNMRAVGESLGDVRASVAGAAAAARGTVERDEPASTPVRRATKEQATPSVPAPPTETSSDTDTARAE